MSGKKLRRLGPRQRRGAGPVISRTGIDECMRRAGTAVKFMRLVELGQFGVEFAHVAIIDSNIVPTDAGRSTLQ